MLIGMASGRVHGDDTDAKNTAYNNAADFTGRFNQINGASRCRDMLGLDIGDQNQLEIYRASNSKETICTGAVSSALEILIELLGQKE